jgi:hypothetical protein
MFVMRERIYAHPVYPIRCIKKRFDFAGVEFIIKTGSRKENVFAYAYYTSASLHSDVRRHAVLCPSKLQIPY